MSFPIRILGDIMGFLNSFFKRDTIANPDYVLVAESPTENTLKMIAHAFLDEKVLSGSELKEKLSKHKIAVVFVADKRGYSKKERLFDIKQAYPMIRKKIKGSPKILLLHNYIQEAIGEQLKKDFPLLEQHNLGYTRSFKKFKQKAKEAVPLYFVKRL